MVERMKELIGLIQEINTEYPKQVDLHVLNAMRSTRKDYEDELKSLYQLQKAVMLVESLEPKKKVKKNGTGE